MAVYTVLTAVEIEALLATLGLGTPLGWQGVGAGIENSTYFLACRKETGGEPLASDTRCEYVLTIAEAAEPEDVAFIAEWMTRLAQSGLPVPPPRRHPVSGSAVVTVQGKPAIVVPKIGGEHLRQPEPAHCAAIGRFLGAAHAVALHSGVYHQSQRSLDWLAQTSHRLLLRLDDADRRLLDEELARLTALQSKALPTGIIHGDLFRDNALFSGPHLSAVIDFFMAGTGPLAFDLAVAVNDWCSRDDLSLNPARVSAMLTAYVCERPLTPIEQQSWHDLLCLAAARFWVSRLQAQLEPRALEPGAQPGNKDPDELRTLLLLRRTQR